MIVNPSRDTKRSRNLHDTVFAVIAIGVVLAIIAAATGAGWCLGAIAGKALELLDVPAATHFGGILGGVTGFVCTIYLCFHRPKPAHRGPGRTISEEEAAEKRRKHIGLVCEHRGWDHCITKPGEAENMACPVCNEVMDVERDIPGIPGYITFIAGMASDHNLYLCRFRQEAWHQQALKLLKLATASPSVKLQQMLEDEARAILKDRKPTKESWSGGVPLIGETSPPV